MKTKRLICSALFVGILLMQSAGATERCSGKHMAVRWEFATSKGQQLLGVPFPPGKDITAIGTMNIERDGSLSGKFDVTLAESFFQPDFTYAGSIIVNPDCTGTITFTTSAGSAGTDSIVVVDRSEILGMSQDPNNLWTYQVRRISGNRRED